MVARLNIRRGRPDMEGPDSITVRMVKDRMERIKNQTIDEWVEEYETGKPVIPACTTHKVQSDPVPDECSLVLRYDHHRTANSYSGVVVLSFLDDQETEYDAFFNADLCHQRGPNRGKMRRTGTGGQFLPPRRGTFRKWFRKVTGSDPVRWSTVHKELRARLKNLRFTGDVDQAVNQYGKPFNRLRNIRLLEGHAGHKKDTQAQQFDDIPF